MSLWRLEVLRLVRTRRWIALVAVYLFFGLLGPITARYLEDLVSFAGGGDEGIVVEFPDPVPVDGMAQYVSNAIQIGTLVTVVIAAGALAFDAVPEMGVFLRTRVPRVRDILVPRMVVSFTAASAAFVIGALAAWYETWALLGSLDAGDVVAGIGLGVLFLAFVISLVAAVAQWASTVLATVMVSLVALLALPVIGIAEAVGRWLPSRLSTALADLPDGGELADYAGAAAVTVLAIGALSWVAVVGAKRREL